MEWSEREWKRHGVDVIDRNQTKTPRTHLQESCLYIYLAHFMHAHVPQSRLEISNKEVYACVRDGVKQTGDVWMQFQSVLTFHLFVILRLSIFVDG